MAHAISSFVQRRRWTADAVFRFMPWVAHGCLRLRWKLRTVAIMIGAMSITVLILIVIVLIIVGIVVSSRF